ncbi:two component transcriptional regulator, LuxR family [Ekhidna lutea]|uniref:Two component transcriptional regulator, LuxR family n=1 Tax=Ekhidna lutea TaxID=447679 RepID=A0A239F936_EKHLU|nr:response regulator transcription factor [Ekhidna lutea]SNS52594.1 two component transcriptional regulator, LuxR family [Ekhidna lutea]
MATSVLLADFQYLTRQGIASLIKAMPGFELIKMVDTQNQLIEQAESINPDLIIIDITDKDKELIPKLRLLKDSLSSHFLVISNSQTKDSIQELLTMGIKGILTKNCSEEEIISGLRAVALGNRFFCNNILDLVVEHPSEEDNCEPTTLSPREFEVLELITKGLTTAQIADHLHLSIHTINSHRKNTLKKLNLNSPTELVVYALETGLVKNS